MFDLETGIKHLNLDGKARGEADSLGRGEMMGQLVYLVSIVAC